LPGFKLKKETLTERLAFFCFNGAMQKVIKEYFCLLRIIKNRPAAQFQQHCFFEKKNKSERIRFKTLFKSF
ncbi:hypothetical protein P9100_03730, partial [Gallibacterium anatis]